MNTTHKLAPLPLRAGAYMIDLFILFPVGELLVAIFGTLNIVGILCGLAAAATYHTAFVQSSWCATPGKRLVGLMVLNSDGRPLDTRSALARHIATILPGLPLYSSLIPLEASMVLVVWISLFWYGMAFITEQRTAVHDILCSTRVFVGRTVK